MTTLNAYPFTFERERQRRDKWDGRFLDLAQNIASWSKDPSTQVGAVIVDDRHGVVSTGYNGLPRGIDDTPERLNDRETKLDLTIHAEMNAILTSGRDLAGCTLYVWPFLSCVRCAVHVLQSGIKRVVAPTLPADKAERWASSFEKARAIYREGGVEVVELPNA